MSWEGDSLYFCNDPGTKAQSFAAPIRLFACVRRMTKRRSPAFRGFSGLPQGSPPLRAAAGRRLEHAKPRPLRAGATSGSGRRSERGGGAAWTGLDNRAAPAQRLGRQVEKPEPRAGRATRDAGQWPGWRRAHCPVAAVEKKRAQIGGVGGRGGQREGRALNGAGEERSGGF